MRERWQVGGFVAEEFVATSRIGEVWRGRDPHGGTVRLTRLVGCDAIGRDRLRRQGAVLASVAGQHVLHLRDVLLTEADAVLVTDAVDAGSLGDLLAARERLAGPEIVTMVGPLAQALAEAHAQGVVHGDVSADSIVFGGDGRPMLADFGVARVLDLWPQAAAATPADDVGALCAAAMSALRRDTAPADLVAAIDAGLAAEPLDRPAADRLALDVLRSCAAAPIRLTCVREQPVAAAPPPVRSLVPQDDAPTPLTRRRVRHLPRGVIGASAAVVLLTLAVVAGVAWGHRDRSSAAVLATPAPTMRASSPSWLSVISDIDERRAAAYSSGDAAALADIYVAGSRASAADVSLLHDLWNTGLRPRGFAITTTSARLLLQRGETVELRVTDAISSYRLVTADGRQVRTVPARSLRAWTLTLVRVGEWWRIAAISR